MSAPTGRCTCCGTEGQQSPAEARRNGGGHYSEGGRIGRRRATRLHAGFPAEEGEGHDLAVQPQGPVFDVVDVVADAFSEIGFAA